MYLCEHSIIEVLYDLDQLELHHLHGKKLQLFCLDEEYPNIFLMISSNTAKRYAFIIYYTMRSCFLLKSVIGIFRYITNQEEYDPT